MARKPLAKLAASYLALRSQACELVADYEAAAATVPGRLLLFAGLRKRPKQNRGPQPIVLHAIAAWLVSQGNEPATYRDIAAGAGLRLIQVRNCISKSQTDCFERVGEELVGDKHLAKVRLSEAGIERYRQTA